MVMDRQQPGKVAAAFDIAEAGLGDRPDLDDDGREKRTGALMTASAHIITAVIGSGVLSLAWAVAQLGWVIGPVVLVAFSAITWFCSSLLADCYRAPDPVHGKRNYTYGQAVRAYLGVSQYRLCALAQYVNLVGVTIGYTITTAISMGAINRSNCFHRNGHDAPCEANNTVDMIIILAGIQILLSQLPNFHKLWWLSIVAAVMSLAYSSIGLGLSIAKIAGGAHAARTTLTGTTVGVDVTASEKVWRTFQSLGDIAFAYSFSNVLLEIQDTLGSSGDEEGVAGGRVDDDDVLHAVRRAGVRGVREQGAGQLPDGVRLLRPVLAGGRGQRLHRGAPHRRVPGVLPARVPGRGGLGAWPDDSGGFLNAEATLRVPLLGGEVRVSPFRVASRTAYVVLTALVATAFPFFNDFVGLIGALSFWPLTVYFPVQMYMAQAKTRRFSSTWAWMNVLSAACLLVSLLAAAGAVQGLVTDLKGYKPFKA